MLAASTDPLPLAVSSPVQAGVLVVGNPGGAGGRPHVPASRGPRYLPGAATRLATSGGPSPCGVPTRLGATRGGSSGPPADRPGAPKTGLGHPMCGALGRPITTLDDVADPPSAGVVGEPVDFRRARRPRFPRNSGIYLYLSPDYSRDDAGRRAFLSRGLDESAWHPPVRRRQGYGSGPPCDGGPGGRSGGPRK